MNHIWKNKDEFVVERNGKCTHTKFLDVTIKEFKRSEMSQDRQIKSDVPTKNRIVRDLYVKWFLRVDYEGEEFTFEINKESGSAFAKYVAKLLSEQLTFDSVKTRITIDPIPHKTKAWHYHNLVFEQIKK